MFFVYILRTSGNTLYTGQTNDLENRLNQHKKKNANGAKYLRIFKSFKLVYSEKFKTRSEALRRENYFKKLTKKQKEEFITANRI